MVQVVKYLRLLVLGLIGVITVIGLGRAVVWVSSSENNAQLAGPPQVFVWRDTRLRAHGYSAVLVEEGGTQGLIASDLGAFVQGRFLRDEAGQITGIDRLNHWPVLLHTGSTVTRFQGDLEALTRLPDGRIGLGFEHLTRVQILAELGQPPKALHRWNLFEKRFDNGTFEALATLRDGAMLAIMERISAQDLTSAYRYTQATGLQSAGVFPVTPGFDVTGADLGPDGCLYILERHFGLFTGFQFQLIRMDPDNWWAPRTLLYRSKPMSLGNGEGVSVWQNGAGLTATLITDDGFPPLSPTRIIELPLGPARGCAGQ